MERLKLINLYLDDLRDCPNKFTLAKTVDEAIYYLTNFEVSILSLDHDLGDHKNSIGVKEIYLHTN
ncbi:MAG: hypothetical protein RSF40_11170, partial [Oscillospiraceae bacterium]